jgi:peptide deformylase
MCSSKAILLLGNPLLREVSQAIADVTNESTQQLIQQLLKTVQEAAGMGLAAPQVGERVRLFIMASHPNTRYPNAPLMQPTAIINPQILWRSEAQEKDWEGCLTVPGLRGLVPRAKKIKVKYDDLYGNSQQADFQGFLARVFQHEYDHLDGIVFIDRVESTHDLMVEAEWQARYAHNPQTYPQADEK